MATPTTAFEDGYIAGLRGADPRECPYPKMTKEWNRWQFAHNIGVKVGFEPDDPSSKSTEPKDGA